MKIYLDMDGVIANFEKRYIDLFKESPGSSRDRKEFGKNWTVFVGDNHFESLEWWPGGQELLKYLSDNKFDVEILTSSGGLKHHDEVTRQKTVWLKDRGITYKVNVVPGRKLKADYATPNSIMIDDTLDVITSFSAAGGIGIHHKDIGNTLSLLDILLTEHINI